MSSIIKSQNVRVDPSAPLEIAGSGTSVRILQDRGVVYALELRCSCGRVTAVELEYAQDAQSPESAPEPSDAQDPLDSPLPTTPSEAA